MGDKDVSNRGQVVPSGERGLAKQSSQLARRGLDLLQAQQAPTVLGTRGTVITIFGAKGGIGKSTIATNLSTALVRATSANVALVDMDTRFYWIPIMMDIGVEQSLADLARHLDEVDRESIKDYLARHHTGVSILPAPLHPTEWRNVTPQHIEKILDLLAQGHDYIIVDTPGTFNDLIATTLELANMIMLVTPLDIASIKDTALALEMLRAAQVSEDKVKLTTNQIVSMGGDGLDAAVRPISSDGLREREEDVERVLEYTVTWRIPYDPHVASSDELGTPIVIAKPGAPFSRAVAEIARAIPMTNSTRRALERHLPRYTASM